MEMTPGEIFLELICSKADYILKNLDNLEKEDFILIMGDITNLCDTVLEIERHRFFEKEDSKKLFFEINRRLEALVDNSHRFRYNSYFNYFALQKIINSWVKQTMLLSKQIY